MNAIQTFNFHSKEVRTATDLNGDVYFCLTDVADVLEISNANPSRFNLDEAGVHKMYISYPSGSKQVTFINVPAMSSREIATLCDKRHSDVKRDIDVMTEQLEIDVSKFAHIYLDSMNRQQTEYLLDKDTCLCLVAGYNAKLRYDFVENKDYISLPKKRKRKNQ